MLALLFVAFFGAALITIARFNASEVRKTEARVAGWELVEIAKAARLYVRDQYALNPAIRNTAATPTPIPLTTLQDGGYLPANFGRTDAAGNPLNALNQRIHVIMVNWSNGGLGGGLTDPATVPSAFVYFAPGGKAARDLMLETVASVREQNVALTAPLFDLAGNNISANCRTSGAPAVALWDTGCLTQAEYATMAAAAGLPGVFAEGGLLMPAWKAVQLDLRAVMRFPSPENPGYATMLTDLGMGTPTGDCTLAANQVQIITTDAAGNPSQTSTNVCDAISDSATANARFNIEHIGNIQAQRLVALPQTRDFGAETANIGTADDDAMRVNGDVTLGSDLRVFNTRDLPAGVPARFDAPNGTVVVERNAYAYSTNIASRGEATIGRIETSNALVSDQLDSAVFRSMDTSTVSGAPQMNVTSETNICDFNPGACTGTVNLWGDAAAELVTEQMTAPSATLRVTDTTGSQAQITGSLDLNGSDATVVGADPASVPGGFTAIAGEISDTGTIAVLSRPDASGGSNADLTFLATNASVTAVSTRNRDLSRPTPVINALNRCLEGVNVADACANRQYVPPNITP